MAKLKEKYGSDMGSGYTSDPNTKTFLARNVKKLNNDGIFRKTWSTWQQVARSGNQKKLGDF